MFPPDRFREIQEKLIKIPPDKFGEIRKQLQNPAPEPNLTFWYLADFSGCGYLRTVWPNEMMNNKYAGKKKYEGIVSSRFLLDQKLISSIRAIHFQRQITDDQVNFIKLVRRIRDENPNQIKYKLYYDLDDLFTEIPKYNIFAKVFYETIANVQKNIEEIKKLVDVFTVSTFPLKKKMMEIPGNCEVKIMPNYLPKYIYGGNIIKTPNSKPRIVWAGSSTHFSGDTPGDLGLILDLIKNTVDEFEWVLLGVKTIPPWLKEHASKIKLVPWVSSFDFPSKLKELNADFGFAPLLNNNFNICKSNIKILDYASADVVAICSNVKPYEEAKVFLKGDWKDDRDQVIEIFTNKEKREKIISGQQRLLNRHWLESNLESYMDLYGYKS